MSTPREFGCTCSGLDAEFGRRCVGCQANDEVAAATLTERARVISIIVHLQSCATCKTVRKTCQALIDRINKETP